jgi:hypothetical protein
MWQLPQGIDNNSIHNTSRRQEAQSIGETDKTAKTATRDQAATAKATRGSAKAAKSTHCQRPVQSTRPTANQASKATRRPVYGQSLQLSHESLEAAHCPATNEPVDKYRSDNVDSGWFADSWCSYESAADYHQDFDQASKATHRPAFLRLAHEELKATHCPATNESAV